MARLHQNNFGTNLTSNTNAGDTTSPLNSIPSIAAPFYIAFDATNINGHYEVLDCTSKTATNVNHAALAYAHTTAEEVRMVVPAVELDSFVATPGTAGVISLNAPEGFLINGKIVPTDAAGITLAVKTLAGTDPSATDPVYCRIGDTVRTISAALSVALADGTNWMNAGSAELATKEIDYFAYLVWDSNSSAVALSFARIPYANLVSDFSATTTNEKYCAGYSGFTTTDEVENIGRFAATLSAGAGYTWSVPTFTASNLIQRPIFETRWLTYVPVLASASGTPPTYTGLFENIYKISLDKLLIKYNWYNASGGTAGSGTNTLTFTTPFTLSSSITAGGFMPFGTALVYENGGTFKTLWCVINTSTTFRFMYDSTQIIANDQSSADRRIQGNLDLPI